MKNKKPISTEEVNDLVRRIGQGDEDAFKILHQRLYNLIFHFLLEFCKDKETIKDAIQSTYEIVIKKSKSLVFYTNCLGWIFTIAKRTLKSIVRKNKRCYSTSSIEGILENSNNDNYIENMPLKLEVDKLDKEQQKLLYLIFYEELTYQEISVVMNISVSTIKRRKAELLKLLKERLSYEED